MDLSQGSKLAMKDLHSELLSQLHERVDKKLLGFGQGICEL
jgi:hypothetical protein